MSRKFGAFDPASTASTTVTTGVVDTSAVVLYLPFDEDIQDDSGVGTSMTAVGNAFVQSSLTQFGAKALYLDGSGDYLQSVQKSSANSIFTLSSASFTIDGWLYPQTFNEVISNFNASNPFAGFTASMNFSPHAAGKLAFFTSDGSAYDTSMASSTAFALNQWSHFAIVRGAISANSLEFFINGVKHGSHTVTREPGTSNNVVRIGASNNSQPNRQFQGAMDDLRIIKGVALYSTNFSVPTTAVGNSIIIGSSTENTRSHSHVWNYPDIYKARRADSWPDLVYDTQIALYLPFNGSLTDFSSYGHTVSAVGDAAVTTSPFQLHGSCAFDGNGDLLTVPHNNIFDFGGNDFTIEGFINPTTAAGVQGVYAQWGGTGSRSFKVVISTNAKLEINGSKDGSSGGQINQIASTALELNTFSHFAVTREGSNYRIFINGVNRGTTTESGALYNSSANIAIGGNRADQTTNTLFGNLEDFRVINGLALYTTAFEVPTRSINNTLTVNP